MKYTKLIKADELSEMSEQARQVHKKIIDLAARFDYEPVISYSHKEEKLRAIYLYGKTKFLSEIRITVYSLYDKPGIEIQTTAYGFLKPEEYEKFLSDCNKTYKCFKAFEKEYIK